MYDVRVGVALITEPFLNEHTAHHFMKPPYFRTIAPEMAITPNHLFVEQMARLSLFKIEQSRLAKKEGFILLE
jgi:hypothetical protein